MVLTDFTWQDLVKNNMRTILFYIVIGCFAFAKAQPPANYYNSANGLTGYALKTELSNIISNGYNNQGYGALHTLYLTSDNDEYYDNGTQTGTILDMYSENPTGADPYNFNGNTNEQCGNYSQEGDCYNREHLFPQGFFNQREPMRSDAHHVIPTDGFVNGGRGSLPFGEVDSSGGGVTTYRNGSRRGPSATSGFTGTVFEPIDEFKGDIARSLFYFATRYEAQYNDTSWDSPNATNDPRDGSQNQYFEQWFVDLLLDWHNADPVSQKEIDRNNDVYLHQNNRNPYIDNPSWITDIWTSSNAPSGRLFVTLEDTYVDTNNNATIDAGDRIEYDYTYNNIGQSILYNLSSTPIVGTFENTVTPVSSLNPGQSITNPFGKLVVVLTNNLINSSPNCELENYLTTTADFNSTGTNGGLSKLSDDPDNFANIDTDGDNLPDDRNRTTVCTSTGVVFNTLFISEYIEGSGNNKAIELSNWTGAPVDLNGYTLARDANGGGNWSGTVTLSGTVADQDVWVIARGNASSTIVNAADQLVSSGSALDFNGNDPVGLFLNGNLIDIVGTFGSGSNDFAKDETLVRKSNVQAPLIPFNKNRDWDVFPTDDTNDLGMHDAVTLSIITSEIGDVILYPNPSTNGTFTIDNFKSDMNYVVFDMTGRIVLNGTENNFTIENQGLYLIQIKQNDKSVTKKIIVR